MIVKVCGMRDSENIRLIEQLSIDWMGFIFYPPSSRYVTERPSYLPKRAKRVGVFVNANIDFVKQRAALFGLNLIQLHGCESPQYCREIKEATGLPIIKAFAIEESTDFTLMNAYEDVATYFLFDTPCCTVGGSGQTFNHRLLARYKGGTPFLLSGGLGPDSANEICQFTHPQFLGIDLNSRFELHPAIKSVSSLQTFLTQLNNIPHYPNN